MIQFERIMEISSKFLYTCSNAEQQVFLGVESNIPIPRRIRALLCTASQFLRLESV